MKVLITPRGFAKYGLDEVKRMESKGLEVDYNDTGRAYSPEQFLKKATDADAIIVGVDRMGDEVIDMCSHLKVICKFGVGTDNINVAHAAKRGIFVGRTVGSNSLSVAEHVAALMFADAKNLWPALREVKGGGWGKPTGTELAGKTLGIVGFGAIGKCLSRIAAGIGMRVKAYDALVVDTKTAEEYGAEIASFDDLLEGSDYVSLHVPLLESTHNLIAEPELKLMKANACLVNAARGGVVDEGDLYNALMNGEIRSACFDVYSKEPPAPDDRLLSLDNFLLTPHIGSRTNESEARTCAVSTGVVLEHLGL
ncbi:phosphoglycerate dehydrogenase [Thermophilibacter immobilis]|uniref:Phosphoglycerate dehydrogenase n=1 Tax=Thermophilibacter immobilis TaxID=2779519 RepID=A0A7S7M8D1_9ACTN|nr:phosphoglycerate dehydrogenase [Thermophilibacter immobilis]QOY60551.1 phosphoglycerate dehydrogenase [Thermophilibacter immobilis]